MSTVLTARQLHDAELYLLQNIADSFVSVLVLLECIANDVAHLQRESTRYRLEFDEAMRFIGKASLADDSHFIDVSDELVIETRGACEDLPNRVHELWREQEKANEAIQRLPDSLNDKLSALIGRPWRPTVRRDCLDWVTIWPGESTTGFGARKVSDRVPTLLENATHFDPHETWRRYVELLHGYMNDILAVRGETTSAAAQADLPVVERLADSADQTARNAASAIDMLHSSLDRSKARFLVAAEKHRPLAALLVHLASHGNKPEPYWPSAFDAQGKYQLNIGGGPQSDPQTMTAGGNRSYSLYGDMFHGSTEADYSEAVREYCDSAAEAGRLLDDFPTRIRQTIWQEWQHGFVEPEPEDLWTNAVFELAWQDHHGSGLSACQWVWHENHKVKLTDVPRLRSDNSPINGLFAGLIEYVGDPPSYWFSWINNVWRASVAAIDVLTGLLRQTPTDLPGKPTPIGADAPFKRNAGIGSTDLTSDTLEPPIKKRSTIKGEARDKIIAGLTAHHKYDNGSCGNLEPINVSSFALGIDVAKSTVSGFLKDKFGDYNQYRVACRQPGIIAAQLKLLNGEILPKELSKPLRDDYSSMAD